MSEETQTVELTVTQALARVRTLQNRLEDKRNTVRIYAARDARRTDPIKQAGGSGGYVVQCMDAIRDLERNLVTIRRVIQESNFTNFLNVLGEERPVQDWLNWRREVLPERKAFLHDVLTQVDDWRRRLSRENDRDADLVVNFDEQKMREELSRLVEIESTLDEHLSVYDATVKVKIPA